MICILCKSNTVHRDFNILCLTCIGHVTHDFKRYTEVMGHGVCESDNDSEG
jgi:hypothetical protein